MTAFEWFIARRYLFSRERKALISVITLISIAGVAVGVAALLVVIGVMDGADQSIFGKWAELTPHLRIQPASGSDMPLDEALLARLRGNPAVALAEPVIQRQVYMQLKGAGAGAPPAVVNLIGIDELGKGHVYNVPDTRTGGPIRLGARQFLPSTPVLYQHLGGRVEQEVLLTATNPVATAMGMGLKSTAMTIVGSFNTGFDKFDEATAFVSTDEIRRLFRIKPGHVDYLHVKLKDPFIAETVKTSLALGPQYKVTTWREENHAFFSALQLEKLGMFITLLLAILVAAFNIIGTLILMVKEKTREVGILRAIGASERTIGRVFLIDGILIGLGGTLAGLALGLTLCYLIPKIPINIPLAVGVVDHIPVQVRLVTVARILLSSCLICTLGALFPARQAAHLKPVEALRYD